MTDTLSELLPCPFCGGNIWIGKVQKPDGQSGWVTSGYRAWCSECKMSMAEKTTKAECIAAWNTRAAPTPDAHSEVGVKALEWKGVGDDCWGEFGGFVYTVKPPSHTPGWRVWVGLSAPGQSAMGGAIVTMKAESREAAIAAAQADFVQRVQSCLTAGVVKAEPVAAGVVVTDEMVERAMMEADKLDCHLDDTDARSILTAALTAEPQAVEPVASGDAEINNTVSKAIAEYVAFRGKSSYSVIGEHMANCALQAVNNAGYVVVPRSTALAQPQPAAVPDAHSEVGVKAEPVAWRYRSHYDDRWEYCSPEQWHAAVNGFRERHPEAQPLYAALASKPDVQAEPVARPANFSGWKERLNDLSNEVGEVVVGPDPDKALDRVQAIIAELIEGFDDVIETEAALASKPEVFENGN